MEPQDLDQPPAASSNGLQPPPAPQPLQPAQPKPTISEGTYGQAPTQSPAQFNAPLPPPEQPQATQLPPSAPEPSKHENNHPAWLLWVIAAGVLLVMAIFVVLWIMSKDSNKQSSGTSPQSSETTDNSAVNLGVNPQFFFARSKEATKNYEIMYTDAVTGKQASQRLVLNDRYNAQDGYITLRDSAAHPSLQFSKDGLTMAYATVREKHNASTNTTEQLGGSFSVTAGSRTGSVQTIMGGKDDSQVMDWVLSASGKYIYYIERLDDEKPDATLYSVNVATGKTEKLADVQYEGAVQYDNSKLFEVVGDDSLRFYASLENGIYETRYDMATKRVARNLLVGQSQYESGFFGDLSPDGKHLMYHGATSSERQISYRIGTENGEVQTIFAPSNPIAYTAASWSHDSKKILYTTTPYGKDGISTDDFAFQLISYDVITNQQVKIAETKASAISDESQVAKYFTPSWSPDKKYIAYFQGSTLYRYDIAKNKTTTTRIADYDPNSQPVEATGWLQNSAKN